MPDAASTTIDWDALSAQLPTERTDAARAKRLELFRSFDPNGNGYLSLAEVDRGLAGLGLAAPRGAIPKPVIMRAFQAARGANNDAPTGGGGGAGADYIERCEFRLLLVYLQKYLSLWRTFAAADGSGDRRVSRDEFRTAVGAMAGELHVTDPDAAFREMDANGGGVVLFDEFAAWVLDKQLALEDKTAE